MTWLLIILLYAPDQEQPIRVVRAFETKAQCWTEANHLSSQALPAGLQGRIVVACEPRAGA